MPCFGLFGGCSISRLSLGVASGLSRLSDVRQSNLPIFCEAAVQQLMCSSIRGATSTWLFDQVEPAGSVWLSTVPIVELLFGLRTRYDMLDQKMIFVFFHFLFD